METKRVRDLMLPLSEYATIDADRTVREALAALDKAQLGLTYDRHHHRAILALDEEGHVVGKVTHHSLLRSLEPRLLEMVDIESLRRVDLGEDFIEKLRGESEHRQQSLQALCRKSARLKVKDAMVAVMEHIDENAPLIEAIHVLVDRHVQSMLVTSNGQVVGILRLSDVFEEIADMIRSTSI